MKIGVIVYSYTENTYAVALKLQQQLIRENMEASIERIHADNEVPSNLKFSLTSIPEIQKYDWLVLASPVRGFSIAPIMKRYLDTISSFHQKPILVLVTHHFPSPLLGGKQTIHSFKKILSSKQGNVLATSIIDWSNKKRDQQINTMIASFVETIKTKKAT